MRIAKWGNSLAVRLPKKVVQALKLKEGDMVNLVPTGKKVLAVERAEDAERQKRLEALKGLRKFRGRLPRDFKFDREEAHERGWRIDEPHERD